MVLKGCTALITGANGGLGSTFVRHLLDNGVAKIFAAARNASSLSQVLALDPSRLRPVSLDLTNDDSVTACALECRDVDLLVNNAGAIATQGFVQQASLQGARLEMEVNYFGLLRICRAFAPILASRGGGSVVNVLSILAKVTIPVAGTYSASKAAALALTTGIRAELASQGTQVIGVLPGTIDTDMGRAFPPPRVSPDEVVRLALAAVESGHSMVYPGEQARQLNEWLATDPAAVEAQMAKYLPQAVANR